jgi:hypothetical protein
VPAGLYRGGCKIARISSSWKKLFVRSIQNPWEIQDPGTAPLACFLDEPRSITSLSRVEGSAKRRYERKAIEAIQERPFCLGEVLRLERRRGLVRAVAL